MHQAASLIAALIAGLLLLSPLSGCNALGDPYQRNDTWAATGVNEANLRAMVADPRDLALGRGDERALAVEAVPPVGRLVTGHRLPLSTESASGLGAETQSRPPRRRVVPMLDSDHRAPAGDDRRLTTEGRIVVAFLEDEASAAAVRLGLAALGPGLPGGGLDVRRGGLRQAIRFFRTLAPVHAAVIDVSDAPDLASGELQPALDELARTCPPEVPIFLVGEATDIGFYRLVVHEMGAADYFPRPLTRDAVQRQLLPRLLGTTPELPDARSGRVVAVCGARGGVGATTIAVNAALALAGMGQSSSVGQSVLLDLHVQNGSAAMMLGARPGTGLRVALEDPARGDALFLERAAIMVEPRLHLVAAEEGLDPAPPVNPEGVVHVLDVLRRRFNFVFVDLPVPVPPELRVVLRLARHVVVVLAPDLPGLRDAHALRQAATLAAGSDRVLTVLNRADMRGALKRELVVRGLGRAPDIVIPDLGGRMTEAINIGAPALAHVPALRRHLLPLVHEFAGLPAVARTGWLRRRLPR